MKAKVFWLFQLENHSANVKYLSNLKAFFVCTGWFIIDLISSMPMDYLFLIMSHGKSGSPSILNASRTLKMLRLTKFLSLMRLLRVSRLMRYANQWQEVSLTSQFFEIFLSNTVTEKVTLGPDIPKTALILFRSEQFKYLYVGSDQGGGRGGWVYIEILMS